MTARRRAGSAPDSRLAMSSTDGQRRPCRGLVRHAAGVAELSNALLSTPVTTAWIGLVGREKSRRRGAWRRPRRRRRASVDFTERPPRSGLPLLAFALAPALALAAAGLMTASLALAALLVEERGHPRQRRVPVDGDLVGRPGLDVVDEAFLR